MRSPAILPGACACLLVVWFAASGAGFAAPAGGAGSLPAIVFVSRQPVPGDAGAIPGLGPHHRAVRTGGRLLVRERGGRVRDLVPTGTFHDVSDPAVSPGARRIAFAGVTHADSAWRIWVVGVDGSGLRQVTFSGSDATVPARGDSPDPAASAEPGFDDLDPCWTDDSTLVFASTRFPQRAQYADLPVTNLFRTCVPVAPGRPCPPVRLTAERNGAEEPTMDWATGRLVFSRWWFNRHRAADMPGGLTTDAALAIAADTVNLWQAMELSLSRPQPRLAAGDLRTRRGMTAYQAIVLPDGALAAVFAANLGLSPRPGGTGIHALSRAFGPARRLAGAIVAGRAGDAYGGAQGLAPPSACAPAALPDGRVLFSYAPGARGDFGLHVMDADGSRITPVFDLPGTLELDAAPIVRRRAPRRREPVADERLGARVEIKRFPSLGSPGNPRSPAADRTDRAHEFPGAAGTFRFHDLDVFADGSPARGAAPRTAGARLRFFAMPARPGRAGGDTAILVREVAVGPGGEVDARDLPAGTPLFEQLVGRDGRVLMTAHGPAHVAGSNAGTAGTTTRCVGCHLGHSTLPAAIATPRTRKDPR